jgi:hypothetical protein
VEILINLRLGFLPGLAAALRCASSGEAGGSYAWVP